MAETVFAVLLGVGVGYAVIGFVLGGLIGHSDADVAGVFPFRTSVIASFVIVFGGTGLLFLQFFYLFVVLPLAGLVGITVAWIFYRFIIIPLSNAQNTTAIGIQSLIGHKAKVTEKIPQGRYGKITYKVNGSTYTAPAKARDGKEICRNICVEITSIENNTYYVSAE